MSQKERVVLRVRLLPRAYRSVRALICLTMHPHLRLGRLNQTARVDPRCCVAVREWAQVARIFLRNGPGRELEVYRALHLCAPEIAVFH